MAPSGFGSGRVTRFSFCFSFFFRCFARSFASICNLSQLLGSPSEDNEGLLADVITPLWVCLLALVLVVSWLLSSDGVSSLFVSFVAGCLKEVRSD